MTEMPSFRIQNPKFETYKTNKRFHYSSSSMISIFLLILTYLLIFYVLEVSPSSIYKDTKVLFFISNILILIISVDYGAFTVRENHDFYGDYQTAVAAMSRRGDNYYQGSVLTYRENPRDAEIKNPREDEPTVKEIVYFSPPERIVRPMSDEKPRIDVAIEKYNPVTDKIVVSVEACSARNQEAWEARKQKACGIRTLEACSARNQEACGEINHANPKPYSRRKSGNTVVDKEAYGAKYHVNPKAYNRRNSDTPRRFTKTEDTKTKRKSYGGSESDKSKWMIIPEKWENITEESEEFSKMSDEELNKRVEDFIQRFNREMRLQSRVLST